MTTNLELAREVGAHVVLRSITLRNAHIDSNLNPLHVPSDVAMTQGYRSSFSQHEEDGRKQLIVLTDFKFSAKVGAGDNSDAEGVEQSDEDLVALEATFQLIYSLPLELTVDEECYKHFAEINGPYNAWPYWRELVQSVTGRVGLAGITIPVFRPPKIEIQKQEKKIAKEKKTKATK
ncbi:hypothetical protein [Dyella koreensis]|uniref:Preprotein translocase subunit SecB n=1 Tax=Dyella koreensis TaxID=311235 RepID=A0ABW8K7G7_9GAMM